MRRGTPWWMRPFVGALVALAGVVVTSVVVAVPVGLAIGRGCGKAVVEQLGQVLDRWVPPGLDPDLDVAPGTSGYVTTLDLAGPQLHFHDKDAGVTSIAVDAWLDDKVRIVVARYDGPPTTSLVPTLLRILDPILPMVVVRAGATPISWAAEGGQPHGPYAAEADGLNLLVVPGRVALWGGDGPRHEIEVGPRERIWCTLGPRGFTIERREPR